MTAAAFAEPQSMDAAATSSMAVGPAIVVTAELVEEPRVQPRPPRVWSSLLVSVLAIPVAVVVSGVVLAVAAIAHRGPQVLQSQEAMLNWIGEYSQTREGLLVLVLPGQAVFLGIALLAALFSKQSLTRRLGLRRGWLPLWTWAVFVLATPTVGALSSLMFSNVMEQESEHLKMMETMLRSHATEFFAGLFLLAAVLPGVVEEIMFRGYLQSRLLDRWHPWAAIMWSAVLFAAAHLDFAHAIGVLPLGMWLGVVAWRAGSVWPAILCHAANNGAALILARLPETDAAELPGDPLTLTFAGLSMAAFALSCLLMLFTRE